MPQPWRLHASPDEWTWRRVSREVDLENAAPSRRIGGERRVDDRRGVEPNITALGKAEPLAEGSHNAPDLGFGQAAQPVRAGHDAPGGALRSSTARCTRNVTMRSRISNGGSTWISPDFTVQGPYPSVSIRLSTTIVQS